MDLLVGLIPPIVVTIIFVALLVTAYRATDRAQGRDVDSEDGGPTQTERTDRPAE